MITNSTMVQHKPFTTGTYAIQIHFGLKGHKPCQYLSAMATNVNTSEQLKDLTNGLSDSMGATLPKGVASFAQVRCDPLSKDISDQFYKEQGIVNDGSTALVIVEQRKL